LIDLPKRTIRRRALKILLNTFEGMKYLSCLSLVLLSIAAGLDYPDNRPLLHVVIWLVTAVILVTALAPLLGRRFQGKAPTAPPLTWSWVDHAPGAAALGFILALPIFSTSYPNNSTGTLQERAYPTLADMKKQDAVNAQKGNKPNN
jgi:hypothetical protein